MSTAQVARFLLPVRKALQTGIRSRQIRFGFVVIFVVIGFALFGPWFAPHPGTELIGMTYGAPTRAAPLGYDFLGRDVLSRVLEGGRSVVWMSLSASAIALVVGTALGLLAAFVKRKVDRAIVWCTDVFMAFPDMILVLLIVSMLGRAHWIIVLTVAVSFVPGVIRLSRGISLGAVSQDYVEAAEMMGYSRTRILFREILPNILTPLLVHLGIMVTGAVGMLSGLAFLGYGVQPPAADWGLMINENRAGLMIQPYAVFVPVLIIALFSLGMSIFSEGLARATSRIEER